ncbi:MAG: GDP-L-fucose synthase [Sedimentisphaerales bacterium]|nr:GDP-L-fucose synthase [Sedimentisphaerales bacterium]
MDKDSKIYVAGHRGLLGSALMKELGAGGFGNIVTRGHRELDLTDKKAVFDFFSSESPDYVFLAAGKVGGIIDNKRHPADYLNVNLGIQTSVFEAATAFESRHVVFYGSSCTYPRECPQPMREDYLLTGMVEPTSLGYAAAKIAGLAACRVYNEQYGVNRFIALVPNSMYGPGDNFDLEHCHVVSALIRRFHEAKIGGAEKVTLWGSGRPRREFIYSRDVAAASLFAVENAGQMENRHYNVGTGVDYSIKELGSIIAETVEYEGQIEWDTSKPDGAARKLLDSERLLSLGWSSTTDLREGLAETYRWYCEQLAVSRG